MQQTEMRWVEVKCEMAQSIKQQNDTEWSTGSDDGGIGDEEE